jgi:hypothetical protein
VRRRLDRTAAGAAQADGGKGKRRRQDHRHSDDLEAIAVDGEAADVPALQGWRRELFGERALKLIRGELALRFANKKVEAVEL